MRNLVRLQGCSVLLLVILQACSVRDLKAVEDFVEGEEEVIEQIIYDESGFQVGKVIEAPESKPSLDGYTDRGTIIRVLSF